MSDAVDTTLAALAIVAEVAAGLIVVAFVAAAVSPRARAALVGSWDGLARQAAALAWLTAAVATAGSLYFSESAGYLPCRLCWFQRIAMYPLVAIILVGLLLRDRRMPLYAIAFPIVGAGFSIYHIYIEVNPEAESAACRQGVPCSTRWIDEFGYVTIPVMALSAFALIAVLLLVGLIAGRRAEAAAAGAPPGSGPAG